MIKKICSVFAVSMLAASLTFAYQPNTDQPKLSDQPLEQTKDMQVNEHLGSKLNLNREFTNEKGETVKLGQFFDGKRPVLMTMVYYGCPSLCNYHLNGLNAVMRGMTSKVGEDYQVLAVSMNHRETAELASKKKASYLKDLGQPNAEQSYHFLVGNEENVKALAEELGFPFRWVEAEQQYAHPAVAYIGTPDGVISRYLYGIAFDAKTLRLSLVEAGNGSIGEFVDHFLLFCYQFNPKKNTYSFYAFNVMRAGAGITVVLMAMFLVPVWWRERKRKRTAKGDF